MFKALFATITCFLQVTSSSLLEDFERIKHALPSLSFREARALFAEVNSRGGGVRVPKIQSKIEHFVVLLVENRAADHIFGCMMGDKEGFDGIPTVILKQIDRD